MKVRFSFDKATVERRGCTLEDVHRTVKDLFAVHSLAETLHDDPNHVPDDVYEALQARYDEETMVVLVTYACFLLANNYFNNIVGTEVDEYLKPYLEK